MVVKNAHLHFMTVITRYQYWKGGLNPDSWESVKYAENWFYIKSKEACKALIQSHSEDLMLYLNR